VVIAMVDAAVAADMLLLPRSKPRCRPKRPRSKPIALLVGASCGADGLLPC
jgi:hypothetical protein